jgi:hypothetical protein
MISRRCSTDRAVCLIFENKEGPSLDYRGKPLFVGFVVFGQKLEPRF